MSPTQPNRTGDPDEPHGDPDEPHGDPDEPHGDPDEPHGDPDEPHGDPDEPHGDPDKLPRVTSPRGVWEFVRLRAGRSPDTPPRGRRRLGSPPRRQRGEIVLSAGLRDGWSTRPADSVPG